MDVGKLVNYSLGNNDYVGRRVGGTLTEMNRRYHLGRVEDKRFNKEYAGKYHGAWCAGGAGYFVSRRTVQKILEGDHQQSIQEELCADKMIGDLLIQSKIELVHDRDFMCIGKKEFFSKIAKQAITMHPLSPQSLFFVMRT